MAKLSRGGVQLVLAATLGVLVAAPTPPAQAAGFGIFEQGTKAMGMAGAFTAQADDPSAMFHNAAGLAFQHERAFAAGTTLITADSDFQGLPPFPGAGATGTGSGGVFFPAHIYYVRPLGPTWTFGLGFNDPFGLTTEWDDKDNWPGRYLSTKVVLRTFDLNPTLAWQATPNFGIGVGAVARFSDVELNRRIPVFNPVSGQVVDAGKAELTSDLDLGYGWNAGLLHKVTPRFSWGLSYRSKIEVDYEGDARFTQISTGVPALDAGVRAQVPFDTNLPLATAIEFPDMASLGLAFGLTRNLVLETDFNWTGWSSFDTVILAFPSNPQFTQVLDQRYEDVYNYRAGLNWTTSPSSEWRFGAVWDESPQPEESVGPLLPDSDRVGLTVGYGHRGRWDFDIAFMYLELDERTRDETFSDPQGFPVDAVFHGTYDSTAYLLGLTLGF